MATDAIVVSKILMNGIGQHEAELIDLITAHDALSLVNDIAVPHANFA